MKRSGAPRSAELARSAAAQETRGEFVLVVAPPAPAHKSCRSTNWISCCEIGSRAKASRTRWRTPSNLPPAAPRDLHPRAAARRRPSRKAMMAKTDDAGPMAAPLRSASPTRRAAFRTGVSAEAARRGLSDRQALSDSRETFSHALWRDRPGRSPRQPRGLCRGQGPRQPRGGRLCSDAAPATAHHRCGAGVAGGAPRTCRIRVRFDVMLIAPRRLPRHLLAAFDASP